MRPSTTSAGTRATIDRRAFLVGSVGVATAAALAACGPGAAPDDARLAAAFEEIEQLGLSVIVAIAREGRAPVVREFGDARDDGIPASSTQVDLNSVTKTVTAAMVLMLVERGELTTETRLGDLLADVPADKADITVHQLLTHTAGFTESIGDDAEQLSRDDYLRRALGTELLGPPGERYRYSNVGYSLLAAIIEVRTGGTYEQFVREAVEPLGLDSTGYRTVYEDARSLRTADDRTVLDASWGGHEPSWNLIGNGGLVSTAGEFVRFLQHYTAGRLVDASLVDVARTPHVAEDSGDSSYGYGMVVQQHPDAGPFVWHDGGNDLFSAIWVEYLDHGDVVFAAAADSPAGTVGDVVGIVSEHLFRTG